MTPITPDEWAARIPWHPKARIVAQLTRAANDLRDEIDALEARRDELDPNAAARTKRDRLSDAPNAAWNWRELRMLGMLCDGDECDGVTRRGGLCGPCSDRSRRAS